MHNVLKFGKGFYNIKTIGTVFAMNIIQEGEDTNEAIFQLILVQAKCLLFLNQLACKIYCW